MVRPRLTIAMMVLICMSILNCGSSDFKYRNDDRIKQLLNVKPDYPKVRFVVMSDSHYYDPSLGTSGSEFQKYLDRDRKMLVESSEILSTATQVISKIEADFVIVCGDMTKDGELANHQAVASHLKKISTSGKPVFVVPGNHDVANGESLQYHEDQTLTVPNVSAAEFKNIYRTYGFDAALEKDPSSLSYVAEPVPGLWLLALDSCRWKENKANHKPITGGAFSADTLIWMEDVLIASKKNRKAVIAVMHHGIWEHYPGNKKFYAKYLIEDFKTVAQMLAAYGVSLVFTGHFHAQDITLATFQEPNSFLFDIETGSLITYPCPYRIVSISNSQSATIQSRFITSIHSLKTDFSQYAQSYCFESSVLLVNTALKKYRMSPQDINRINTQVAQALMIHLAGDEKKPETPVTDEGMGLWGKFIFSMRKDLVDGWHTDLWPEDNQLTIDLKTGETL